MIEATLFFVLGVWAAQFAPVKNTVDAGIAKVKAFFAK